MVQPSSSVNMKRLKDGNSWVRRMWKWRLLLALNLNKQLNEEIKIKKISD